jgi:FKBP-type peptidyl-prolyl cis-trans isomerase
MRLLLCSAVVVVALVLAGCGGGSSSSSTSARHEQAATTGTTPQQTIIHFQNTFPRPSNPGPHPNARVERLIVKDIRKGSGPVIHAGDSGIFEFIATNYVSGQPLEEAWHRRRPFETRIEHNVVIDGWWQGIPGMRVGGRRQIIIPPSLGFTTNPTLIGATTYFDVVLVQVNPAQPAALGGRAAAG